VGNTAAQSQSEPEAQAQKVGGYEASGRHLLLTLTDCCPELLNDLEALRELASDAAVATGATVLNVCAQKFEPQGATVVVVLAESHASLHTYPEVQKVFWDCFTCGTVCDPEKSISVLKKRLGARSVSFQTVSRV
jgi:S-adenosylmethionine decarboxylase